MSATTISGLDIPDSLLAKKTTKILLDYSTALFFNHFAYICSQFSKDPLLKNLQRLQRDYCIPFQDSEPPD